MADPSAIARPYAQAVFELAAANRTLPAWSAVLGAAAAAVDDAEVRRLLKAPGVSLAGLAQALAEICVAEVGKVSALAEGEQHQVGNFLRLLAENDRLAVLPQISAVFEMLKARAESRIDVVLAAASPVDEAQQAKIASALSRRFGREVNLEVRVDQTLIGGARLQVGDLVIDGSVRTGLEKLAGTLVK